MSQRAASRALRLVRGYHHNGPPRYSAFTGTSQWQLGTARWCSSTAVAASEAVAWPTSSSSPVTSSTESTADENRKSALCGALLRRLATSVAPNGVAVPISRREMEETLRQLVGSSEDQAPVTSAELSSVWLETTTSYYVCHIGGKDSDWGASSGEELIVSCDWESVLSGIASGLPYEGVTEEDFVSRLRLKCPRLRTPVSASLPGSHGLAAWIVQHFPHVLLVTRSAVTREPLYYAARRNNVSGVSVGPPKAAANASASRAEVKAMETVQALQHALHVLGRGKQLPVWTELHDVAPLLPSSVCPPTDQWMSFLTQPCVQELFDVETTVKVRQSQKQPRTLVIVDATSLSTTAAQQELLQSLDLPKNQYVLKVLRRPASAEAEPTAASALLDGAEEVLMDDVLDAEHVVGAIIGSFEGSHTRKEAAETEVDMSSPSTEAGSPASCRVYVLTGSEGKGALQSALSEEKQDGVQIVLCTPDDGPLAL